MHLSLIGGGMSRRDGARQPPRPPFSYGHDVAHGCTFPRSVRILGVMKVLGPLDWIALAFFATAWWGYALAVESRRWGPMSLNGRMNGFRHLWMERMLTREVRIIDTQIM